MITTAFNQIFSLVDSVTQEVLTSQTAIMTQAYIPFTRLDNSYTKIPHNINNGLTRGRMSSFPMETHSQIESYTSKGYGDATKTRSTPPMRSINTGEFSGRRSELLLNSEEIQHFTGQNSNGLIPRIVASKISAALAPMAFAFQKYIELKFLMRNQCYAHKMTPDGTAAVPFTINYLDNNAASFEIFNILSSRARSLIGQPTTQMMHIMSKKAQAALYSGTAANRLTMYADDTIANLTKSSYMDMLLDSIVCPSNTEILHKPASSGMPTIDAATGNPTKVINYKIAAANLEYNKNLDNTFTGGTITLDVDDAALVGKTLVTGDVFFIKGSTLIKGITGYTSTDFMVPIIIGPVAIPNTERPTSYLTEYTHGTFTFVAKTGGATITNLPIVMTLRPMLANNNPMFMNNDPNCIMNKNVATQPFASATTIEADMVTFLKAATLVPLVGERQHIIMYPQKKIYIMPRIVSFPNTLFSGEVSELQKTPDYLMMTQDSALPICYRFDGFGGEKGLQGKELHSELFAESSADFDNYNHNTAAIAFAYKD